MEKVKELVLRLRLTEGAEETIKELKKRGYIVGVVSGGFTVATDRIKDILGLDYAYSNELIENDGVLTGEVRGPIMDENAKGKILEEIAKKEGIDLKDTVVVGDGANDISMFKKAGLKIPAPRVKLIAPNVVAFVPACNLLNTSGILNTPSPPRKKNIEPTPINIIPII